MSGLAALYQDLIVEHSRHPRNFRVLAGASHQAHRDNPFCGDELTIYLALANDRISEVTFQGSGCAISQASASLMTEAVSGLARGEVEALGRSFERLVAGEQVPAVELGKLAAFAAVAPFKVRAECARLPWRALLAALRGGQHAQ
jgi:nitrogen fixation protein NifU and related proteins